MGVSKLSISGGIWEQQHSEPKPPAKSTEPTAVQQKPQVVLELDVVGVPGSHQMGQVVFSRLMQIQI